MIFITEAIVKTMFAATIIWALLGLIVFIAGLVIMVQSGFMKISLWEKENGILLLNMGLITLVMTTLITCSLFYNIVAIFTSVILTAIISIILLIKLINK